LLIFGKLSLLEVKLSLLIIEVIVFFSQLSREIDLVGLDFTPDQGHVSELVGVLDDTSGSLRAVTLSVKLCLELAHGKVRAAPGSLAVDVEAVEVLVHDEHGDVGDRTQVYELLKLEGVRVRV
jgi:hypothetical protein